MLSKHLLLVVIIISIFAGCQAGKSDTKGASPVTPIRNIKDIMDVKKALFIEYPTPERFSICYGHTCRYYADVALNEDDWAVIQEIFSGGDSSPIHERELISNAIAILENIVGERTGTANDKGENFIGLGKKGQMDCVDESTNTTVYLTMLQNDGLLKWHVVDHRISRGILTLQVPHFTAVIREHENDIQFAVDSWFLDNGEPPFIVPIEIWQDGWSPDQ